MTEDMCQELGKILISKHLTVSCAESLTGGLIGASITAVSGSSEYFLGSAVTYSNDSKEKVLGVPLGLIMQYGAVSEAVALQMARGARSLFSSDVAVSCTGIAGPGGATDVKPVGLVYIGFSSAGMEKVARFIFDGTRDDVRKHTVIEAISLIKQSVDFDQC